MDRRDHPSVGHVADALWQAEVERTPIDPVTSAWQDLTIDDAYAIQTHNVDRRVAAGAVVRGRKVGLTSRASQDVLGVREPNFGVLLDDMFVDEGDAVALGDLVAPRVEAEIAFVMATDLAGPGVTTTDALTAVSGVLAAIEIVDSRIADWRIRIADTVADNASSARAVLGARLVPVTALDLPLVGVLFHRNGTPIDSGAGAAALGNPARCVAWLANKLGALGSGLRKGDIVLSGALHRMVPVRPGDVFQARFAHLGSVTVQFGGGELMTDPHAIADVLIEAERTRTAVAPMTRRYPFLDVETAYKAQALVVEHRTRAGERVVGAKLGFTSAVKRRALGIHEPVYGRLTSGMVLPFGGAVRLDELINPRAEPEIAFVIGRRIAGVTTVAEVLRATEAVLPAIEIVDTRYAAAFRLPDSVADNAGAARIALGTRARRPADLEDLSVLGCVFRHRGGIDTAAGGAAMGHPAAALVWLAAALEARGEALDEGTIVLSGGLTASVPLRADGLVSAEFDGLGSITVRCV